MRRLAGLLLVLLSCSAACASTPARTTDPVDPWERMNRGIFAFNEGADRYVLEPAAKGWDFVVPDFAQTGVSNFFENLRMPRYVVNNLLQARFDDALFEVFRFTLNVMLGFGGFLDIAARADWPHYPEEFDLTFAHWGIPSGPYVVLPVFGPSTVRGTAGLAADSTTAVYNWFVPFYIPIAATATDTLNQRAIFLEEIAQSRQEAFDFYLFVRSAYLQNRQHRLRGAGGDGRSGLFGASAAGEEGDDGSDDLYYFDDVDELDEAPESDEDPARMGEEETSR